MGYAGGDQPDPSYHHLGDHREAVEVTFDTSLISYETLLEVFWSGQPNHIPPGPDPRVHLAIMPHGSAQRAIAERSKDAVHRQRGETVYVDIVPNPAFWPAERLHQKFSLQRGHGDLIEELAAREPATYTRQPATHASRQLDPVDAFLQSTVATRLNSWLGPFGDDGDLIDAADELGMAPEILRRRMSVSSSEAGSQNEFSPGSERSAHETPPVKPLEDEISTPDSARRPTDPDPPSRD